MIVEDGRVVNHHLSVATPGIAIADSHNVVDFIPRRFRGRSAGELFAAARRRFALQTSKLVDRFFDARHGTETAAPVENTELRDVTSTNLARGIRYEPTRAIPLRRVLRAARIPTDGTFVDVGGGKGRACMLAVEHGFERVVGIDYSPHLCAIARRNLDIFAARSGKHFARDIRSMDATEYAFSGDDSVVYLFNPFDDAVLERVLQRVRD